MVILIRLLALIIIASGLFGCSSPRLISQLDQYEASTLPVSHELREVPFFPQEKFQCGPASLATMLRHRGIAVTPATLKPEVYLPKAEGSLQLELIAAARKRGLLVYPLKPSLIDMMREVADGNPVLVLQNLGLGWFPQWHYAVVVGYDLSEQYLVLRSGTNKRQQLSMSLFERTWRGGGYWAIVILPTDTLPQTAERMAYLEAAQSLESVALLAEANRAYQSALQQWPGDWLAMMGLGNTYYGMQAFMDAVSAFEKLTKEHPNKPEGWNNFAYSLSAIACHKEARVAIECAIGLSDNEKTFVQSKSEIQQMKPLYHAKGKANCPLVRCRY